MTTLDTRTHQCPNETKPHPCVEPPEIACGTGERNRFFPGKILTAHDLQREQDYQVGRRRMLNRTLHGWGVVSGLQVSANDGWPLEVTEGLALDKHGRELIEPAQRCLESCDLVVVENGHCHPFGQTHATGAVYLLSAHYAERRTGPISLAGSCNDERREWNRLCETVIYSLSKWEPKAKGCDCPLDCDCPPAGETNRACVRSPEVLCCWSKASNVADNGGSPCRLREEVWANLGAGVPLATVEVGWDETCGRPKFGVPENCAPRRLVKRADMLFDLIRGCDLTRISHLSWLNVDNPQEIEWSKFACWFSAEAVDEEVKTQLRIGFSRKVRIDNLNSGSVTITAYFYEGNTAWRVPKRLPVLRLEPTTTSELGMADEFVIFVDANWVADEIKIASSEFTGDSDQGPFSNRIEFEVHGDLILDCNGIPVDANSAGPSIVPTGNGTPGGVCRSVVSVGLRTKDQKPPPNVRQSRRKSTV